MVLQLGGWRTAALTHQYVLTFVSLPLTRLIKHTKQLLEENEERLCIKVLQTLREMMTKDRGYGEKVHNFLVPVSHHLRVVVPKIHPHMR